MSQALICGAVILLFLLIILLIVIVVMSYEVDIFLALSRYQYNGVIPVPTT
jgi:hypothetical protein